VEYERQKDYDHGKKVCKLIVNYVLLLFVLINCCCVSDSDECIIHGQCLMVVLHK